MFLLSETPIVDGAAGEAGTLPEAADGAVTGRGLAYLHRPAGERHIRTRQRLIGHTPAAAPAGTAATETA